MSRTVTTAWAAMVFIAAPSVAATTKLRVTGAVDSVIALQNSQPTTTPAGIVNVGDQYVLEATFDFNRAELTSLYDADPTVNIYYLQGTTVSLSMGGYNRTFAPPLSMNASIQLWNDHIVTGPTDAQSFSFFDYDVLPRNALPFDLGAGQQSASTTFSAFDFSALARTNDLITQFSPLSTFGSKSFSFGQLNSDTGLFVYVGGTVATATLGDAPAVPEPKAWALLIVGFAAVGIVMRQRPRMSVHCV